MSTRIDTKKSKSDISLAKPKSFKRTLISYSIFIAMNATVFTSNVYAQVEEPEATSNTASETSQIEEITVFGRARDQELSIAAKRESKKIIDTITADVASRLPDNNIAESLGRLPGITFLRDIDTGDGAFISIRGLDSALNNVQFDGINATTPTGGTRRVSIDGLTSDNISELRVSKSLLPEDEGEGIGGSVNIITKTPLQRGEDRFTYGFESRDAEFADKPGYVLRANGTKIFNDNFGANLSASFRRREIRNYEIDNSGTNLLNLPTFTLGGQEFTNADIIANGNDDLLDAGTAFDAVPVGTFSSDVLDFENQLYTTQRQTRDTVTLSGAIDWQVSGNTLLTLGGRYSDEDVIATQNTLGFDDDDGDFEEIDGQLVTDFRDPEIDLLFEIEDRTNRQSSFYLKGQTELDRWQFDYVASIASGKRNNPAISLGFDTDGLLDRDTVNQNPYTLTNTYFPIPNLDVLNDPDYVEALSNFGGTQNADELEVDLIDRRENERTAFRLDAEFDAGWQAFGGVFNSIKLGAKFERSDIDREEVLFEDDLSSSRRRRVAPDGSYISNDDNDGAIDRRATLDSFPDLFTGGFQSLSDIEDPLSAIGVSGIPMLNDRAFRNFYANFLNGVNASGGPDFTLEDGEFTRAFIDITEDITASYIQSEFEVGNLSLIGGIRVENFDTSFRNPALFESSLEITNLTDPLDEDSDETVSLELFRSDIGDVFEQSSSNTEYLPRLNATYLVNDNFQIRAGVGRSLARPTISQLSRPVTTSLDIELTRDEVGDTPILPGVGSVGEAITAGGFALDDIEDGRIRVRSGNANLENASSSNYDLSFEYYPKKGTSLTAGLFYKRIKNFIFVGAEPDAGTIDISSVEAALSEEANTLLAPLGGIQGLIDSNLIDVDFVVPQNGDVASVRGIELGMNHRFDWAPGFLSDIGMNANVTFTESDAFISVKESLEDDDALVILGIQDEGDRLLRRTSFFNSPDRSANFSIFYEANGFELALSGSYQDFSFNSTDDFGLDQFDEDYHRLDFYAEYEFDLKNSDTEISLYFEAPDFTDDGTKPSAVQTVGQNGDLFDLATFNGREFRFGIRGKF